MDFITNIFNHPFFTIVGGISTTIVIVGFASTGFLAWKGVISVLYRIGRGLSGRKIAILAEGEEFGRLKRLITESGIFKEKNIVQVDTKTIDKAEEITLLLVHWNTFKDHMTDVFKHVGHQDSLIVYAPQDEGFIDEENMKKINLKSSAVVVNHRGRLLNDIFSCMATTAYRKK